MIIYRFFSILVLIRPGNRNREGFKVQKQVNIWKVQMDFAQIFNRICLWWSSTGFFNCGIDPAREPEPGRLGGGLRSPSFFFFLYGVYLMVGIFFEISEASWKIYQCIKQNFIFFQNGVIFSFFLSFFSVNKRQRGSSFFLLFLSHTKVEWINNNATTQKQKQKHTLYIKHIFSCFKRWPQCGG